MSKKIYLMKSFGPAIIVYKTVEIQKHTFYVRIAAHIDDKKGGF